MSLKTLELSGAWLERGFWLYVWEVQIPERKQKVYYVGRTGDSSSLNAASPFNRMGQHLDLRKSATAAMLIKNLAKKGFATPRAYDYRLTAVGPLFREILVADHKNPTDQERQKHRCIRDKVASVECHLEKALRKIGCEVLNEANCKAELDKEFWDQVRNSFAEKFPELKNYRP